MPKITKMKAREILDSRGNPTVEVDVFTEKGVSRASVPSGASTGKHEALELRDNERRYLGRGVLKAVSNVKNIIARKIVGRDCTEQKEIDELMIQLDGTSTKSNLGANAVLAVSMAVCKAGALESNLPLYRYIANLVDSEATTLPIPMVNVINSGAHAGIQNDFQEYMIVPLARAMAKEETGGLYFALFVASVIPLALLYIGSASYLIGVILLVVFIYNMYQLSKTRKVKGEPVLGEERRKLKMRNDSGFRGSWSGGKFLFYR